MGNLIKHEPYFTMVAPEARFSVDGKQVIFGYWATFNTRSRVLKTPKGIEFIETIMPGAFDDTDFSDVQCLFNHSGHNYLASEPSLRWGIDQVGAWYEFDFDADDSEHQSLMRKMKRFEIKGSSFQFLPLPTSCYTVTDEGGIKLRRVHKFTRVGEFGPVIVPAYNSTTAFARSLDEAIAEDVVGVDDFPPAVEAVVPELEAIEAVEADADSMIEVGHDIEETVLDEEVVVVDEVVTRRLNQIRVLNALYPNM